jgi:hypothetical protein
MIRQIPLKALNDFDYITLATGTTRADACGIREFLQRRETIGKPLPEACQTGSAAGADDVIFLKIHNPSRIGVILVVKRAIQSLKYSTLIGTGFFSV